jgi:hypothetical protein
MICYFGEIRENAKEGFRINSIRHAAKSGSQQLANNSRLVEHFYGIKHDNYA